ncbi:hypothetical protein ZIOFF_012154 [Zingiber officinale]|uniref:Uncharacterized protein n=1 Tax=Zingiber officinale TaxID=94328 RepID=A0A8J5M087_ZINOF|nr:hypothetical protein ZIOFF_012154 [Zingiber officinale]
MKFVIIVVYISSESWVVLLEGKKVIYLEESGAERSLSLSFIVAMKEGRVAEFFAHQVRKDAEAQLQEFAKLVVQYLSVFKRRKACDKRSGRRTFKI